MNNSLFFPNNSIDYTNSLANNLFETVNKRDWRRLLPGRFRTAEQTLSILPQETTDNVDMAETSTRRVSLNSVRGSVSSARGEDFDPAFRPIRKHLKDRWYLPCVPSYHCRASLRE